MANIHGVFVNGKPVEFESLGNTFTLKEPPAQVKTRGIKAFILRTIGLIFRDEKIYNLGMQSQVIAFYGNRAQKIAVYNAIDGQSMFILEQRYDD